MAFFPRQIKKITKSFRLTEAEAEKFRTLRGYKFKWEWTEIVILALEELLLQADRERLDLGDKVKLTCAKCGCTYSVMKPDTSAKTTKGKTDDQAHDPANARKRSRKQAPAKPLGGRR